MRVEKTVRLPADPATVWDALTNPEITKQYFFGCEAISDWQVGSSFVSRFEKDGEQIIAVQGVITAVEPGKLLEHTWS